MNKVYCHQKEKPPCDLCWIFDQGTSPNFVVTGAGFNSFTNGPPDGFESQYNKLSGHYLRNFQLAYNTVMP